MAEKGLDVKTLFDGLMKSLENSVRTPPWQHRRDKGQWPDKRSAELELLGKQFSAQRADSQSGVEADYEERREDLRNVVGERKRRLEAYAGRNRQAIPAEADKFIVAGRVTDQDSGVGLPNVEVKASDRDRKQLHLLGSARTDSMGYFRVEYAEKDFFDPVEGKQPETVIEILGEDGEVIHTASRSVVQKAGAVEFLKVEVDGESVSRSLDAGQRINESVKMRINALETRERLLSSRKVALQRKKPATPRKAAAKRSATKKTPSGAAAVASESRVAAEPAVAATRPSRKKATAARKARSKKPGA